MRAIAIAAAILAPVLAIESIPSQNDASNRSAHISNTSHPAPKTAITCPDSNDVIFTDVSGYAYQIECDTDYDAPVIGAGHASADLDACIAKCIITDDCRYASFAMGICTLKGPDVIPSASTPGTVCAHQLDHPNRSSGVISKTSSTVRSLTAGGYESHSRTFTTKTRTDYSIPSATASASKTSSYSEPSNCGTNPKSTYTAGSIPGCKRCEGQPGTDKFCGFDINTNWYEHTPITCNVVTYELDIIETTASPDGYERFVMLVNGQLPGPTIKASWGDTVVVKVNNKLTANGTAIHFHGLRQLNNSAFDGVPAITQCPIAPGDSMTYTWVAENYGSTWYHSHYAIQAYEGVYGPIDIDGPKIAEYDHDLGFFAINDWSHFTVDERYHMQENGTQIPGEPRNVTFGGPVAMDNGLINGKNVWNGADSDGPPIGARFEIPTKLTPGKKYLMRFINAAIQSTYKLYLDQHEFQVIANDLVPIHPYTTTILNIHPGQRYEVIVEATQKGGSFWFRADNQNSCAKTVQAKDIKAIVHYEGDDSTPTSTAYTYTDECIDEPLESLVPVVPLDAGAPDIIPGGGALDVLIENNDAQLLKWYLSGTTFKSDWGDPTLLSVYKNDSLPEYSGNLLIEAPARGQWVYVIIESAMPVPHPIHMHGHDIAVLGAGKGAYDGSKLNLKNPVRRDTALMPGSGWLVVGFETDNPGAWVLHCHIGWHASMGFALQFVEMQDQIKGSSTYDSGCDMEDNCISWRSWAAANGKSVMHESGV